MFLSNKYYLWYLSIIQKAKSLSLIGYSELHHIIPRSLGGSNDPDNLVELTARQHFICHRLLTKFTVGEQKRKMVFAIHLMVHCKSIKHGDNRNWTISSRTYEHLRLEYSKTISGFKHSEESKRKMSIASKASRSLDVIKRISDAQKGRKFTDDHKQKLSKAAKRQFEDPEQRRIASENAKKRIYSEETKLKMKESSAKRDLTPELRDKFRTAKDSWTGRNHSEESRKKISESSKGKVISSETKQKISETLKGKTFDKVECPHCKKSGAINMMKRYHFEKCKFMTRHER
jgi:hypothetical protein